MSRSAPALRVPVLLGILHVAGGILSFVSLFLPWTRIRTLADLAGLYLPGGHVIFGAGAVTCIGISLLDMMTRFRHGSVLVVKIAGTTCIAAVFLFITSAFQELVGIGVGYFLAGTGLIACTFEIVASIIVHVNLDALPAGEGTGMLPETVLAIEQGFYEALNHEIRRRILRIIGAGGQVTFTEFKKAIDAGTGTLYHHMNVLGPLIVQGDDKKYRLSRLGQYTLQFMTDNLPVLTGVDGAPLALPGVSAPRSVVQSIPTRVSVVLGRVLAGPRRIPCLFLATFVMLACSAVLGFHWWFLFFSVRSSLGAWGIVISVAGWLIAWGIMEGLARGYFKKQGNRLVSLAAVGTCSVPVFLHDVIMSLVGLAGMNPAAAGVLGVVLLVVAQLVMVFLLVAFQMHHKSLSAQKALSIVMPVHYLAIFLTVVVLFVA